MVEPCALCARAAESLRAGRPALAFATGRNSPYFTPGQPDRIFLFSECGEPTVKDRSVVDLNMTLPKVSCQP